MTNDDADFMEGNISYLREKYAIGFITLYELNIGLDSVLAGGAINVPQREAHALRGCPTCLATRPMLAAGH